MTVRPSTEEMLAGTATIPSRTLRSLDQERGFEPNEREGTSMAADEQTPVREILLLGPYGVLGTGVGDAAYALGFPPFSPLGLVVGRCHRSGLMAAGPAAG
jgi:hypothetical protein